MMSKILKLKKKINPPFEAQDWPKQLYLTIPGGFAIKLFFSFIADGEAN
jgi:hypothetical protein